MLPSGLRVLASVVVAVWFAASSNAETVPYCKQDKKCVALVIANAHYQDPDVSRTLTYTAENSERISGTLASLGFKVKLGKDLTREQMMFEARDFGDRAKDADVVLFYFDGQGFGLDGNTYLLPVDAKAPVTKGDASRQAVGLESMVETIRLERKDQSALIIMTDTCRNQPDFESTKGTGPWEGAQKGLFRVGPPSETYYFHAAQYGRCSYDQNTFAESVADALEQPGDIVRVLGQAGERVRLETNLGQSPELSIQNVRGRPLCLVRCEDTQLGPDLAAIVAEKSKGECFGEWLRPETGEPRYALVVGNNGYTDWSVLEQPTKDADLISGALSETQFSVRKCYNLPREKLKEEFANYARFLKQEASDLLMEGEGRRPSGFVYFSGHGASRAADGTTYDYLVPTDSTAEAPNDLVDAAMNITAYADELENIGANAVFVVIDACRNVLDESKGNGDDFKAQRIKLRSGMLVAYATSADARAREHSGYARLLSEYMLRPGERASIAFEDVGIAIRQESENRQIPVYENQLRSAWKFLP